MSQSPEIWTWSMPVLHGFVLCSLRDGRKIGIGKYIVTLTWCTSWENG